MGEDGCGRATGEVRDPGSERAGADDGAVPRVWDIAADGLSVAGKIPASRKRHGGGGAQPKARAQSCADRSALRRTRGGAAARIWMGGEEAGRVVAGSKHAADCENDPPHSEAPRTGPLKRFRPARAVTVGRCRAEPVVADGRQA